MLWISAINTILSLIQEHKCQRARFCFWVSRGGSGRTKYVYCTNTQTLPSSRRGRRRGRLERIFLSIFLKLKHISC